LWRRDDRAKGANDNAAGLTTMIGIAEYFAKIPKEQRRRTIVFLGTTGHHNSSAESGAWLAAHPEAFDKTALLLNYEHTGGVETGPGNIRLANAVAAFSWYGTGQQLADIVVHAMDAFGVPSFPQSSPSPPGKIGRYYRLAPSVQIINGGYVWHSDQETAETISAGGLAGGDPHVCQGHRRYGRDPDRPVALGPRACRAVALPRFIGASLPAAAVPSSSAGRRSTAPPGQGSGTHSRPRPRRCAPRRH
jgi:hypothetical protein